MESFTGLFSVGSTGFWVLIVIASCFLIGMVEWEKPGWATTSLIVTLLLLGSFGNFNVIAFARENPTFALACGVGYFVVGTLWAFGKWWFYLQNVKARYEEERSVFLKENNIGTRHIPDELLKTWKDKSSYFAPPRARNNKVRILVWMMHWPWSCVWTIINDPVKKAFKAIFEKVQARFQKMADDTFADVKDDFRSPPAQDPEVDPKISQRKPPHWVK